MTGLRDEAGGAAGGGAAPAGRPAAAGGEGAAPEPASEEVYLGVVKSYNDRRGFGFLACTETADRYGRDVYMPKAEAAHAAAEAAASGLDGEAARVAAALAAEAAAAAAAASAAGAAPPDAAEKPPPAPRLAEEDLVVFRVRLSVEGYPQAACVKKLRKVSGVVSRLPTDDKEAPDHEAGETADAAEETDRGESFGLIDSAASADAHGLRQVPWPRASCGQLRLAVGDEVTFCVPAALEALSEEEKAANGTPRPMAAQMIALANTSRAAGSVLGCFTLELPRTGAGEDAPPRPSLHLDCHAFGDKLILAGLPADLDESELMRFFSKQGASQAIVARAKTCSFASVSFPSVLEVARFLGRTAHAFADDKETRIARLLPLVLGAADKARLPALPAPTMAPGEDVGSLLVVWSPLLLAIAYSVELRPAGAAGHWITVDGNNGNRFDSTCSSCKVAGLHPTTAYEARVYYFTECGTVSEASEASDVCLPTPTAQQAAAAGVGAPNGGYSAAPPPAAAYEFGAADYLGMQPMVAQNTLPAPPDWAPWLAPDGQPWGGAPAPPTHDGYGAPLPPYPSPGWRSPTGLVVPPPAAPELRPADEYGFSISIQWPAVIQATAYVVELREAGSAAVERFVRQAPEARMGTLVELRVGGLRPGPPPGKVYVAQTRTVGADGSESAPSTPGWSPPLPSLPAGSAGTPPPAAAGGLSAALSAEAPVFQPTTPTGACTGALLSVPAATALAPPSPPPSALAPGWAATPWPGPPPAGPALGPPSGAPAAPPSGPPGHAPACGEEAPWGVRGSPPPPPPEPPALAQRGQAPGEDPPLEEAGREECLILD